MVGNGGPGVLVLRRLVLAVAFLKNAGLSTVVAIANTIVEVDFTADNPGNTLFHCHQRLHMDFGFMALMK